MGRSGRLQNWDVGYIYCLDCTNCFMVCAEVKTSQIVGHKPMLFIMCPLPQ